MTLKIKEVSGMSYMFLGIGSTAFDGVFSVLPLPCSDTFLDSLCLAHALLADPRTPCWTRIRDSECVESGIMGMELVELIGSVDTEFSMDGRRSRLLRLPPTKDPVPKLPKSGPAPSPSSSSGPPSPSFNPIVDSGY